MGWRGGHERRVGGLLVLGLVVRWLLGLVLVVVRRLPLDFVKINVGLERVLVFTVLQFSLFYMVCGSLGVKRDEMNDDRV